MRGGRRENSGRKKGSASKRVIQWEEFGRQLFDENLPRVQMILKKSNDREFMAHFLDLVAYFKPKPKQSMEIDISQDDPIKNYLKLGTPLEKHQYIENLKRKLKV
ncbi:MAG: hypothetical protein WKF87_17850 [Chryseolinea sp.]